MVLLLEVLAVLAIVFGVAVVLTGRAEGLSDEAPDRAATGIPRDRAMTAADVVGLRFALAFRGYRMDEVDDALDRLSAELAARDDAIAQLRAAAEAAPAPPAPPAAEPAYVPSDATGEVEPGTPVDVPTTPEEWAAVLDAPAASAAPDPETPSFVEPSEPSEPSSANPFRPEVPEIKTYDPWSVTPRSRYTDGPTFVEVEHPDDDEHAEAVAQHQTGYAPVLGATPPVPPEQPVEAPEAPTPPSAPPIPPASPEPAFPPASEAPDATVAMPAVDDERPLPPWHGAAASEPAGDDDTTGTTA